jgi:ribosomal protein L32
METEEKTDFAKIFEERQKRFRPIAFALLGLIGLALIVPPVFLALGYTEILPYFLYFFIFPFVLAVIPVWQMNKCPNCGKYMGKTPDTFCPGCGAQIRKNPTKKEDEGPQNNNPK